MKCPGCGCEVQKPAKNNRCPECGIRIKKKRPPKRDFGSVFSKLFWLYFSIGPIIIGVILLFIGIPKTTAYYREVKPRLREITAVISRVEEYENRDGETYHDVYITYQYNGVVYEDVSYPHYNSSMASGQRILVEIDPENPTEILSSGLGMVIGGGCAILFGCLLSYFLWVRPVISKRKASSFKEDPKKLTRERIAFDLAEHHEINGFALLFSLAMSVGFLAFEIMAFSFFFSGQWGGGLAMGLGGFVFLIFPAIFFFAFRHDRKVRRAVKKDTFLLIRVRYAGNQEETIFNSDGPDFVHWILNFHNCDLTCSTDSISALEDGTPFCLVMLPGETKVLRSYPLAHYDHSALRFDKTY